MWLNLNHDIPFYIKCCSLVVTGYITSYLYLISTRRIRYKGDARFLTGKFQNGNQITSCSLHLVNYEACSETCRYAFLTWLISYIDGAKSQLDVCMYFLSLDEFADALLRAKERGVQIRLIVNVNEENTEMGSVLLKLQRAYIRIRSVRTRISQLMHLKMILIDHKYVMYGSTNFTKSAIELNSEEMVVLSHPSLIVNCERFFEGVWEDMTDHHEFFVRIWRIAEETLKEKAKTKSAPVIQVCDEGVW